MVLPGFIPPGGASRPPVPSYPYDVIIIGGGVNGVAIARECAIGGKRTLLLEQNDFASGTSSRATRIIHGGLRYLEHGELALVRESLQERELLLRTKPNLVHPKRFILAIPRHSNPFSLRSPLALRAGMAVYRTLAGRHDRAPSAAQDVAMLERSLDSGQRWILLDYEDAQCEFPERLIADWLGEAVGAGAVVRNHCEVLTVEIANGSASGVHVRDRFTAEETRFSATWIINATGPWADRLTEASAIKSARMIGGVRGSHILLPRFAGAPQAAVYSEASDDRPIFIIPWNGQTLIGTTEVADDSDPANAAANAKEISYLMQSFLRIFPASGLSHSDIIATYAGVRPLPFAKNNSNASATTRKHFLHDHSDDGARGLISIIGGKLTTATSLARDCAKTIGVQSTTPPNGLLFPGNGSGDTVDDISHLHGTSTAAIMAIAARSPDFAMPLCPHSKHIVAEAVYAVQQEFSVTFGDILLRRVPIALSQCWSEECAQTAAVRIGKALGWSEADIASAREDFENERNAFLRKPGSLKAS